MRCRGTRLGNSMDSIFSVQKPKLLRKQTRAYPGIIVRHHLTVQKQMGLLIERYAGLKEGAAGVLLQSGLDEKWWADSMECCTYLRNIKDLLFRGKTPYERRFGEPFQGPIIPFGLMVEYHPISAGDLSRLHQFGKKVSPGILGYVLCAGGIWKGDILVADIEEFEKMDASSMLGDSMRRKCQRPKNGENIKFPIADGTDKLPGGDQVLRTSTLIRDNPDRGEEQENLPGESDGSPPPLQNSSPDDGEARNDFWSISGNYILPSSRWTESQTVRAERRISPNSTTIH